MPARKAAKLATQGFTPARMSAAAVDAPKVNDPSAVMSGKSKTRKLMKMPSANRDKIRPIVMEPISNDMMVRV